MHSHCLKKLDPVPSEHNGDHQIKKFAKDETGIFTLQLTASSRHPDTQMVSPRPANRLKLSPLAHFLNYVSIMAQINFHFLKEAFLGYSNLHGSPPSLKFLEKELIVLQYLIVYSPVFRFFSFSSRSSSKKKKKEEEDLTTKWVLEEAIRFQVFLNHLVRRWSPPGVLLFPDLIKAVAPKMLGITIIT